MGNFLRYLAHFHHGLESLAVRLVETMLFGVWQVTDHSAHEVRVELVIVEV